MSVFNTAKVHDNEVVKAVDFDFGFKSFIDNFALGMNLVMQQSTNFIIGGRVKKSASGGMNLAIEPVYSFCKTAVTDIFQGAANDETTDLVTALNSGAKDRIDILEICGQLESYDEQQRAVNDPETNIKTYPMLDVKQRVKVAARVKAGTEGSATAPATTAGWVKIAEIKIPANSVEIKEENIFPVTADIDGLPNTGWTNEKTSTISIGRISEINGRFRTEHNQDGTHGAKVIHAANIDYGTASAQVNSSQIPKGGTAKTAGGSTLNPSDSVSVAVGKLADEINSLAIQTAGSTMDGVRKYFTIQSPKKADVITILARAGEEITIGIEASDGIYKWASFAVRGSDTFSKILKLYSDSSNNLVIYGESYSDFSIKSMNGIKYTVSSSTSAPSGTTEISILTLKRDSEPVKGSSNLITSGGTYTAIEKNTNGISTLGSTVSSLEGQIKNAYSYINGVLGRYSLSDQEAAAATTANISLNGVQTIDGFQTVVGSVVLVKDQTDSKQNGLYTVSTTNWARTEGFTSESGLKEKLFKVSNGTKNKNKVFYITESTFIPDSTSITFSEFSKITSAEISDLAVTTAKIADSAVTSAKIGGTVSVAKGGTGAASALGAEYNLLGAVGTAETVPDDSRYLALRNQTLSAADGTFRWTKCSAVWTWIASKISSALGLTAASYSGKAATAGTADSAKACTGNSATATSASYPAGFSSRTSGSASWGDTTGTSLTEWISSNGGAVDFRSNGTQCNMKIDGYFYQNEGTYQVIDTNTVKSASVSYAESAGNAAKANGITFAVV